VHLDGQLVLPNSVIPGRITFDTHITTITPLPEAPDRYILPGFIDTHVHGGNGHDTMDGPDAIRALSRFHLAHGTTTILPTTITRPWPDVMDALRAIAEVRKTGVQNGPAIHGAHLEGPFVSPHKLGAQPPYAIPPETHRVREALETGIVRVVTLAPELPHAETAIPLFTKAGVRVSLGHTIASCEQTTTALCQICATGGTAGATHLFNAMNPLTGRDPGPVAALFCHDEAHAEMIFDTHHVHPDSFKLAHKILDRRLLFITDAMRGAGQGDGPSQLGGQNVTITNGIARLDNGSLAGSVLTLDQALRNALATGTPLHKAAQLVSSNAARYLGLTDRGELQPDRRADFTLLNTSYGIDEVWTDGSRKA